MSNYIRGVDDLVDRDRGFLTQHDREYLLGHYDDMTDNAEQQKRFQIRERFRQAMLDFHFMSEYLTAEDKRLLWPEIEFWLWDVRNQRQRYEDFEYPEVPFLIKCWRDVISLFVECHTYTVFREDEMLARWAIEEGVNKGIRKKAMRELQAYKRVDASLDWGTGEGMALIRYLNEIAIDMPKEPEEAEEYLDKLERQGYLTAGHSVYLKETYVE